MKTFTKTELLFLIDALDEWVYENNLTERKELEEKVKDGYFSYPNILYVGFSEFYKLNPVKALCKLVMKHYGELIYHTDQSIFIISDHKTLYSALKKRDICLT